MDSPFGCTTISDIFFIITATAFVVDSPVGCTTNSDIVTCCGADNANATQSAMSPALNIGVSLTICSLNCPTISVSTNPGLMLVTLILEFANESSFLSDSVITFTACLEAQ
uniref:Putative secreted protein n=1 Tax=Panstrongylus lignarius TaxID=156445 RepID=A0A224Y0V2_9HEMI